MVRSCERCKIAEFEDVQHRKFCEVCAPFAAIEREKARYYSKKEAISTQRRAFREDNKEELRAQGRAYYAKNKETLNRQSSERYHRVKHEQAPNQILIAARERAGRKGLEFNLTLEDIVIPEVCPYLGIAIHKTEGKQGPHSPSLDRIDNASGYVKGNVEVISNKANRVKSDATWQEIQGIASRLRGLIEERNGA
jgi:hypothetical protein